MSETIEIRLATLDDADAINMHFNKMFGAARSPEMFNWKFSPYTWRRAVPPGYIALHNRVVVGLYAVMSWKLVAFDTLVNVVQPCDVSVAKEVQGQFVYFDVYREFRNSCPLFSRLAFGFPSRRSLMVGYEKMGYRFQNTTRLYSLAACSVMYDESIEIEVSDTIPDSWFPYVTVETAMMGITTHRSQQFMRWRYQNFPDRHFSFLTVGGESPTGVAAFTLWRDCAKIYDLIGDSPEIIQAMIGKITRLLPGKTVIYGTTDCNPYIDSLERMRFEIANEGALVTSLLTDNGNDCPDPLTDTMRASHQWFATWADTDM